jgi:hypothetical protein
MKTPALFALLATAFALGACENHPPRSQAEFAEKTHRTYNPETGSFEQSPPFGKQSNKSTDETGQ